MHSGQGLRASRMHLAGEKSESLLCAIPETASKPKTSILGDILTTSKLKET